MHMTDTSTLQETTEAQPRILRFEMSPNIGALVGALAKARKTFKPIIKEETNPFFKSKYADLAAVIEATKDGLSDNGLAVIQPPAFDKSTATVEILTLLAHASGEWVKATLEMPLSKQDAQGVGSAITYGRRYAYSAVLNVASESDDDANAAVSKPKAKATETDAEFDQRTSEQTCIAVYQIQAIDEAIKRTGKTEEEVLAYLQLIGHKRIEHLYKDQFKDFLMWANSSQSKIGQAKAAVEKAGGTLKPASQIKAPSKVPGHNWPKLWASAKDKGIPQEDVKRYYQETYGVESGTQLSPEQFAEVAVWVASLES